jgi:hypothetical protein
VKKIYSINDFNGRSTRKVDTEGLAKVFNKFINTCISIFGSEFANLDTGIDDCTLRIEIGPKQAELIVKIYHANFALHQYSIITHHVERDHKIGE